MTARAFLLMNKEKADFQEIRYEVKMCDKNLCDDHGRSLAMHAALNGHIGIISDLWKRGAEFNLQDPAGDTALHLSISADEKNAAGLLLTYGADCMLANHAGETGLTAAIRAEWNDLVDQMLKTEPVIFNPESNSCPAYDFAAECADGQDEFGDRAKIAVAVRELYHKQRDAWIVERDAQLEELGRRGMPIGEKVRDEGQITTKQRRRMSP